MGLPIYTDWRGGSHGSILVIVGRLTKMILLKGMVGLGMVCIMDHWMKKEGDYVHERTGHSCGSFSHGMTLQLRQIHYEPVQTTIVSPDWRR